MSEIDELADEFLEIGAEIERLRRRRRELVAKMKATGLTQRRIGRRIGLGQPYVSQLLKESRDG